MFLPSSAVQHVIFKVVLCVSVTNTVLLLFLFSALHMYVEYISFMHFQYTVMMMKKNKQR